MFMIVIFHHFSSVSWCVLFGHPGWPKAKRVLPFPEVERVVAKGAGCWNIDIDL